MDDAHDVAVEDEDAATQASPDRPPGPLTQGLRDLRAHAELPAHPQSSSPSSSPSPPPSPLLYSEPEEGEASFLSAIDDEPVFAPWASDEVDIRDTPPHEEGYVDVGEVRATPSSRSPPVPLTDPPSAPRVASVVVRPSTPVNSSASHPTRHFRFRLRFLPNW